MGNFWLIARHEYRKLAVKRSFFIATLGIPLLIVVIMAVTITIAVANQNNRPLGYVDQASILLTNTTSETSDELTTVVLQPFSDEASARYALEQEQIQGYYVLPADYLQTRHLNLYYWEKSPSAAAQKAFLSLIRANLAGDLPPAVQQRLAASPPVIVRSLDGSREMDSGNILNIILPFAIAFLFFFTVMTSAGYLLQVVADDKENRTIEILITSLSPEQLIGGKAVGLMAVSLTQLAVWLVAIAAGLVVGAKFLEPLQQARFPWMMLLIAALYFLPTFALIAAIMTAIGGAVTDMRQGQQIAGIINLLFSLPLFFSALVFANPDSPVLVFLTLFPTTSFVTILLRWSTSVLPIWQLAASWILLTGSAVLGLWASARIFRGGMLHYGQHLDLRAILSAVRSPNA